MSTHIFWFSGTGNSLAVARELAAALGDAELKGIPGALREGPATNADAVGIVFPVYMWGPPLIVKRFIRELRLEGNPYIFSVVTYGGSPAGTLTLLKKELAARDLSLSAGFGIRMPGNYTPLYGALPTEKQNTMFRDKSDKIPVIARVVRSGKKTDIESGTFLADLILSRLLYRKMSPRIPGMDKDFWAETSCNGCGTCVRICPTRNIELKNERPRWQGKCEQCLACLQWCPQEAIQLRKKTVGRKRYRNPEITIQDIAP